MEDTFKMDDALLEYFFGDTPVEEIPIDENAYVQEYISVTERMTACRRGTSNTNKTLNSKIESKKIKIATTEVEQEGEPIDMTFSKKDIDAMTEIEIDGEQRYSIPYPKSQMLDSWSKKIKTHQQYLNGQLQNLSYFYPDTDCTDIEEICSRAEFQVGANFKKAFLKAQMHERYLKERLQTFAKTCKGITMKPDAVSDGLWAMIESKAFISTGLEEAPDIVQERVLRLDSKSLNLLIEIHFSKNPSKRANAKVDLSSKLSDTSLDMMRKEPDKMLLIAFAEAKLTNAEMLALMFPIGKSGLHKCINCNVNITLSGKTYHSRCKVVDWLIKYQGFMYLEEEAALVSIRKKYVDAQTRARLSQLLTLHDRLNNDVIVRSSRETFVWKRNADSTLTRQQVLGQAEEEVIGTRAWKEKRGYSPHKARVAVDHTNEASENESEAIASNDEGVV